MTEEELRVYGWRMADAKILPYFSKLKHSKFIRTDAPKEFAIRKSVIRHFSSAIFLIIFTS